MIHVVLGCLSWIFFYASVKSHFREKTNLDEWEYLCDKDTGILFPDPSLEEERTEEEPPIEDVKEEKDEDPSSEGEQSDADYEDYVMTSDPDEDGEVNPDDEVVQEEKESSDDAKEEESSAAGELLTPATTTAPEPRQELSSISKAWISTRHCGFEKFREDVLKDLNWSETIDAKGCLCRVREIMDSEWTTTLATIAACKSFEMSHYTPRVRARLLAPAIWQNYTIGDRELCEYIFARSIYKWVE